MANEKKLVEQITAMDEDFAKWYTDIVKKADLIDYSSVKGCMIIKPAGYAIWEQIQNQLDAEAFAGVANFENGAHLASAQSAAKATRAISVLFIL